MIETSRVVVVEGKYDKIKLDNLVDGIIIPIGGFSIYKDKEKQALLRVLAQKNGLAVLTDSDNAGFQIRRFLHNICAGGDVVDVYIPDLYGKEKRKSHPSKEGKLGVEGVPADVVREAFRKAQVCCKDLENKNINSRKITKADFFEKGLTGSQNSAAKRAELLKLLELPEHLTTNSLIVVLNALMTFEEFEEKII